MTNKDKFLKYGVSVEEFIEFLKSKQPNNKFDMTFHDIALWLNTPIKPTLTEDERVILSNIEYGYKYIYRHCSYLYIKSFEKGCFDTNKVNMERKFDMYDHLFQFIQERRRIRDSRTFERRVKIC